MRERAHQFFELLNQRRSVREFSDEPIPLDVVRTAIHTAGTAPSGAHKQPWRFVLVTDRDRVVAELTAPRGGTAETVPDVVIADLVRKGLATPRHP